MISRKEGAWRALHPEAQLALTQWAPKAPLDFAGCYPLAVIERFEDS
jgi:hypothetical protein